MKNLYRNQLRFQFQLIQNSIFQSKNQIQGGLTQEQSIQTQLKEKVIKINFKQLKGFGGQVLYINYPPFLNKMRRSFTKESFGKVYRQFSRQKYNKYKLQFPKLRDSQIIEKIMREWDMMQKEQRQELGCKFYQLNFIRDDEEKSNSDSIKKQTPLKVNKPVNFTPQAKFQTTITKISVHNSAFQEEQSDFHRYSQKQSEQRKSESMSMMIQKISTKRMKKQSFGTNKQYIKFYQKRYKQHSSLHPQWNSMKISQIIKLEWQKKLSYFKRLSKFPLMIKKNKKIKKISGYQLYKLKKNDLFNQNFQIKQAWNHLPLQSKLIYIRQAQELSTNVHPNIKKQINIVLKPEILMSTSSNSQYGDDSQLDFRPTVNKIQKLFCSSI